MIHLRKVITSMRRYIPIMYFFCLSMTPCPSLADETAIPKFDSPPLKYTNEKLIGGVVAEPTGTATVMDELLIGNRSKEKLTFWFYIYGSNFHICSLAGDAMLLSNDIYQYLEENCDLRITTKPESVELEDIGDNCKELFCGSRAYIDKSTFRKAD